MQLIANTVFQSVITCRGSGFLEELCEPRDAALRGVRVEKKQVNSVSRFQCERLASLYFYVFNSSTFGFGCDIASLIRLERQQRGHLPVGCLAVCHFEPVSGQYRQFIYLFIYFYLSGLQALPLASRCLCREPGCRVTPGPLCPPTVGTSAYISL